MTTYLSGTFLTFSCRLANTAIQQKWSIVCHFQLKANPPSSSTQSRYSIVYKWRLEQELYMKAHNGGRGMSDSAVKSFVRFQSSGHTIPYLFPDLLIDIYPAMYFLATCHPLRTTIASGSAAALFCILMKTEMLRMLVIFEVSHLNTIMNIQSIASSSDHELPRQICCDL